MKPVSPSFMIAQNAIMISNIQQGLTQYPHQILSLTEKGYRELIEQLITKNGVKNSYVDFYFFRLAKEEQQTLICSLEDREKDYLASLSFEPEEIYFQLEETDRLLVDMLCKLNASEILFSTFYFTKFPCTLWGNYGLSYPVFWNSPHAYTTEFPNL